MTADSGAEPAARMLPASADILQRLETLYPTSIDLHLGRVERLLEALGRPQDALPPVVHVAGTNGKGSLIAFLKAILEAGGARVHAFTSPHLVRFHERIALAGPHGGVPVSEAALSALLLRVERANAGEPITFFEITTAAALLAFAEQPADFVLLETGLGGRLDATNVVARPALTVITPVSHDHEAYLGTTLAEIAGEKAGILKPDVPCVVAGQEPEALAVIEERAGALNAPLIVQGRQWDAYEQHGRLVFQTDKAVMDLPLPRLLGRHQITNAGAAVAAAKALPEARVDETTLGIGLQTAVWPARLQRLADGALRTLVDDGTEILLDGGHNPAAAVVLARAMADLEERVPLPLHLICGMMRTKDAAGFLAPFRGLAEWVVTVPVPGREKAYAPHDLAQVAAAHGLQAIPRASVSKALELSTSRGGPVRVLICGSLYLAGHVLELNG